MRYETCLTCRVPGAAELDVRAVVLVAEAVGPFTHHHHIVECAGCQQWWFDDIVTGGLGIPIPSRRDTELCPCDENLSQYTRAAIVVPMPESECACTKAQVDEWKLPIHVGNKR